MILHYCRLLSLSQGVPLNGLQLFVQSEEVLLVIRGDDPPFPVKLTLKLESEPLLLPRKDPLNHLSHFLGLFILA